MVLGIGALVIYSLVLFFLFKKYWGKMEEKYQLLLKGINAMAEGNLDVEFDEDLGIFEPLKEQLSHIRDGFKKAVAQEVKSERTKSELITNVSHDLKTPLTAIITYINLLKAGKSVRRGAQFLYPGTGPQSHALEGADRRSF